MKDKELRKGSLFVMPHGSALFIRPGGDNFELCIPGSMFAGRQLPRGTVGIVTKLIQPAYHEEKNHLAYGIVMGQKIIIDRSDLRCLIEVLD